MTSVGHSADLNRALYEINSIADWKMDPGRALDRILGIIFEVIGADGAAIALRMPESESVRLERVKGSSSGQYRAELRLGQGIVGWVALHEEPFIAGDVRNEPRYIPMNPRTRSKMVVPMSAQGSTVGVISVESDRVRAFSSDDLQILTRLSTEASRVMTLLWLLEHQGRKAGQFEAVIRIGQNLVVNLELETLLDDLTESCLRIFQCRLSALYLYRPETDDLVLRSIFDPSGRVEFRETLPLSESVLGTVIQRQRQIEVLKLWKTEEHHFVELGQREDLVSMLSSPILFEGRAIGLLNAYTGRLHRFDDEERKLIGTLASLGGIAIQNCRLYTRIIKSQEALQQSEKLTALGHLAAEIAHEIRNPLTVMKLLFQSLELQFDRGDQRNRDVKVIEEKFNQLESIVERILSFGKASGAASSSLDLGQVIRETLDLARVKLEQQKIALHFESPRAPLAVDAIKGQLQQILLNLILNSTQAMPKGGAITLGTYPEIRGGAEVAAIEIVDTGPGIPEALRDRLFEGSLFRDEGPVGLGLNIVKRILREHRGDITVAKSGPNGTTMKFWLPLTPRNSRLEGGS